MQIRFKPDTTHSETLRTSAAAVGGDGAALQRLRRAAGVGVARHRRHRVGRRDAGWPLPPARPPRPGADLLNRKRFDPMQSIALTDTHGCCLRAVQAAAACHRGALPVQCAPLERSTATGGFHFDAVEYPERCPQVV